MRAQKSRPLSFLVPAVFLVVSCVTINLYFPEKEVKDLADEIEQQVQAKAEESVPGQEETPPEGASPPAQGDKGSESDSRSRSLGSVGVMDALLGISPAQAQEIPEPETTNPAIRRIIDSRAARLPDVNKYKSSGVIGENNKGDLEIRDLGAVSDLRARAEVQKLVRAENADREQLYKEIATAKNIDPSQLDRIRETYAETLREYARPGDWIQLPDGSWKRKS